MKRVVAILCLALCLLTAGCKTAKKETKPSDTGAPEKTPDNVTTDTVKDEADWDGGLVMLRQAMTETPQVMAVAYLGSYNGEDLDEFLTDRCATMLDNHPIFTELTPDMMLGSGYELYCVVAKDENAQISVNKLDESGNVTDVLHKCDGKKPILIAANGAGFSPDTAISLVDENGNVQYYCFTTDDNGRLEKNDAVHDFSSYKDFLTFSYNENIEDGWQKATADNVAGTSWDAEKYTVDGRIKTYHLDFFENTVNIQWNDGIDADDHVFTADWSIEGSDGKIKIDLNNLDGERTFVMLISSDAMLMQMLEDFTEDDTMRDYEPLQTLFEKTVG